jgi:autotransporter-associated beta strand protein
MKSKINPFLGHSLVLAASSTFLATGPALAATYDWTGATDSNFTEAGNWTQNSWDEWNDYRIGGTPTNASITINGYFGIGSLTLQSGLATDIVINSSTANPVIMHAGIAGSATIAIASDSKNLTINGEYIAGAAVTWDVGAGRTLTMNGPFNNWFTTASLIKNGAGTAVLAGAFGVSGGATINGGTLELNVPSGSRDLGSTSFSGPGTLSKTGAGVVGWGAGSATFALGAGSLIDVRAGSFGGGSNANEVWTNNLAGLNVASGATFNGVEANVRVDALTGAGTITSGYPGAGYANFTFGVNNGSGTFSGSLTDSDSAAANFVKAGSGTQTLTGPLDYNGTTTVSGGILMLPDGDWKTGGRFSNGTGASGTIIVGPGATLSTSSGVTGLQNGLVLNGGTVSSRGLVYSNYRNLLLESNITAGGAATSTISSEISLAGDREIAVGADSTLNITGGIANDGFFGGSQGITKSGTGTLTLAAASTYTGTTTVSSGTLKVTGQNYLPGSGGITIGLNATLMTDAPNDDNTQGLTSTMTLNGGTLAAGPGASANNGFGPWGNFHMGNGASLQAGGATSSTISASLGLGTGVKPINVDGGSTLNISGDIFGVSFVAYGQFSKSGDGTLVLGGNNKATSQGMILSAGTVEFATNSLPTNLRASGGPAGYSVDFQGNATLRWAAGNTVDISFENGSSQIRIGDGVTANFDTNGNNVTLGTAFDLGASQTGAVAKSGAGTLALTAANSYTGSTTVNEGTLILGDGTNNTGLSDTNDVIIASGATLQLNYAAGSPDTIDELSLGGVLVAPGTYNAANSNGFITGTGSLIVENGPIADPFANWMATNFPTIASPDNAPGADPDNDGIDNLMEYVLQGGNPGVSTTGTLPTVNATGANFVFTYFRRAAATGTTQRFEHSTTLGAGSWSQVAIPGGAGVTVTDQGGGIDKVEITVAKGINTKLFGRLQVVK